MFCWLGGGRSIFSARSCSSGGVSADEWRRPRYYRSDMASDTANVLLGERRDRDFEAGVEDLESFQIVVDPRTLKVRPDLPQPRQQHPPTDLTSLLTSKAISIVLHFASNVYYFTPS
jgi:hypothetical protein